MDLKHSYHLQTGENMYFEYYPEEWLDEDWYNARIITCLNGVYYALEKDDKQ